MKLLPAFSLFLFLPFIAAAQTRQLVFTSDIDHFWTAFDSAKMTADTLRQRQYFQRLYVDRASDGLKEFRRVRNYSAPLYVRLINKSPRFWQRAARCNCAPA